MSESIHGRPSSRKNTLYGLLALIILAAGWEELAAAPAAPLFEDDFDRDAPGWTAVQPFGFYIDGPMRWQYDVVSGAWIETSNIYTDTAQSSPSATAVMLINAAVAPSNFTYTARLTAGDDDGFGLVFGYHDDINFYRVTFSRQTNALRGAGQYPGVGWKVDRKVDDVTTTLFGSGTPAGAHSFTNTAARPFDVTISVTGANRFSLTVVDDPDGTAVTHHLVMDQPLPDSAEGQVGLVSWGMSGANPRSFRISNLNLTPGGLVNYPPTNQLSQWTAVVPPRADGTAPLGGHGQGLWGLALGPNGPYGTLHEGSDAFGGNDAAGRLDFVSPTLVAGDVNWSNYVLSTRVLPSDDDGHGVLLRYRNETNFYRIALRFQSSGVGARKGLSVQKVVDGIFEETYFESPVSNYDPTPGLPYELLAAINGNELQIVVVGDPDGARRTFFYGPINMAGNNGLTVDQGKVGVFSWAMTLTQFDFVRVEQVEGVPLLVASSFGPADPPVGLNDFPAASEITASVPAVVEEQPGIRRIPTGFSGLGSVPASGSTNRITFTLNSLSLINWQWRTEYRLMAMAAAGGTVVAPAEEWQPEGSNITVMAQANAGFLFDGWSGNSFSADASLSFPMTRPVTLTARFVADTDGDGLADPFEQAYFGNLDQGAAGDADNDGGTNLAEYQQGTDPTFAEMPVAADGLSSTVENAQRDPVLPGQFIVRDFGQGFRGAWEVSNDFRGADDPTIIGATSFVANVSFDGPRLVIRNEAWDPAWSSNSTAQVVFTVGDNDGNCVYWRYQNESNWYRVTVCGEDNNAVWRAPLGVSIQKRIGNVFTQLASDAGIFTDPDDGTDPGSIAGWKRIRVTIITDGPNHTVTVEGWDARAMPPDWSAAFTVSLMFTDGDLPAGRLGFGSWGQGTDPAPATAEIPVDDGMLIEEVRIEGATANTFHEDWSTAPMVDQFPTGWSNPYAGLGGPELGWRMSAHGTIFQVSNFAPPPSGTFGQPRADADGPILLGPSPGVANYLLEVGFHPFDDDGIGFVYDFLDPDNFARVLFVSQPSGDGRIPQGLNVTRKSAGVWSDIIAEDLSFLYQPGHPFAVRFANNNGAYRLFAWEIDNPGTVYSWTWTDQRASANNRFGLATWGEVDGHFLHARAFGLPELTVPELRILRIQLDNGMVTLSIGNTTGRPYGVEMTSSLGPPAWTPAATAQTGSQWTGPAPIGATQAFYRLVGQ